MSTKISIQWVKKLPQCLLILRDQYGMKCWHKQGTLYYYTNYYYILALKQTLGHVIWIKIHWVIGQIKQSLIGAVFWPSSYFLLFWLLWSNARWVKTMGGINNVMWLYLYQFGMLELVLPSSWPFTTIMKATSTAQHNSVVSLLNESYSQHQIKLKLV
jgi:hypothetical protein